MTDDSRWKPIDSAPKDGTWIMLHYRDGCVPLITFWADLGEGYWMHKDQLGYNKPTHWQPLPNPPE